MPSGVEGDVTTVDGRTPRPVDVDRIPDGLPAQRRPGYDLTRWRVLAWWMHRRSWQFQLIAPTQILFWTVIGVGLFGVDDFDANFATTITWLVWFGLVFVLIAFTGRGWCAVCPFGGMAEWIQRRRLWHGRTRHTPHVTRAAPTWLSRYGYVPTAAMFGVFTWVEEYYEVADGASPARTSWTVIGIILLALLTFAAFQRRSFCRYVCPMGGLIGALGAGAPVSGFRARDRQVCLRCTTRDCLRGNDNAYGCPWFNWPGGTDSHINCGLCGECFRACPSNNVGLFIDRPLAGLTRPRDRRADVAWTVAIIGGIMASQHLRTTATYDHVDSWFNAAMGMPHGPNPLLFALLAAACTLILVSPAWLSRAALFHPPAGGLSPRDGSFVYRVTPFRVFFLPLAYAAIPLLAADFIAVELVGFLRDSPKMLAAAGHLAGMAPDGLAGMRSAHLLDGPAVIAVQLTVLVVGAIASTAVATTIAGSEVAPMVRSALAVRVGAGALMATAGVLVVAVYVLTQGDAG